MFKNILIIGCGMIGSSVLRAVITQKICKQIYIFETNLKHRNQIRGINKKIVIIKKLEMIEQKSKFLMDLVVSLQP